MGKTPYRERKTSLGLYISYEMDDGDLIVNLYKYKEDEDFDHNDLIKSIAIGLHDDNISLYEKLHSSFGDIINGK